MANDSMAQLWRTAYHEAGHAVIGYRLGLWGGPITIVPNATANTLGAADVADPPADGSEDEKYTIFCFAGLAAERLIAPEADGKGSWCDDQKAAELPFWSWDSPDTGNRLRTEAEGLVKDNWVQIEAVATALVENKTLYHWEWQGIVNAKDNWLEAKWREAPLSSAGDEDENRR